MLFTPFHVPHPVRSLPRVRKEEVRCGPPVPGWALVWTNLGSSWPHLRTGQGRSKRREMWAGLTPLPAEGLAAGKRVALRGTGLDSVFHGWHGAPVLGRTPWSSLCPPFLGPGGPSQQVSFLLVLRLSWAAGTHLHPSQCPVPATLGETGGGWGVRGWGGAAGCTTL